MNEILNQKDIPTSRKMILLCLGVLPFLIGIFAYLEFYPEDYSNAVYFAILNYLLGYDMEERSIWLELARWGGVLVTTSVILSFMQSVFSFFKREIVLCFKKEVVAVYGATKHVRNLQEDLLEKKIPFVTGKKGLSRKNILHHVLMFESPQENLAFYAKYGKIFHTKTHTHLLLDKISPFILYQTEGNIYPFSFEALTAQKFWLDTRSTVEKLSHQESTLHIVLIGSGFLLEEILNYGVQLNIYHKDQKIIYHIFGAFENYEGLHHKLSKTEKEDWTEYEIYPKDTLRFYHKPWQQQGETIHQGNMLILAGKDDVETLEMASQLKLAFPLNMPFYLHLKESDLLETAFSQKNNIYSFGHMEEICTAEQITNNKAIDYGTKLNGVYANAKSPEEAIELWQKLSHFHQNSNLFSILFWINRLDDEKIANSIEELAELEHIRWNRFHYMYNWVYGEKKNNEARTHPCLIDFHDLSREEKDKDKNTILLLQKLGFQSK